MADWNPRANDLFLKAAEIGSPGERQAYLDRECGDPGLRSEVDALLAAAAKAGSFLNSPAGNGTATYWPAHGLEVGQVFAGRFKLREELGEGGMGVVFVADQLEPVQRRVALKVIKSGADSARVLARFELERQALALMDHPNIAKVLDAGVSDTGQPYFVMDLIKGVPLSRYCDEARLAPRERLELFIPVCQAVQHAHQKGIIHRDLKPSNILVGLYDGRPMPKVIDFGVAKATGPRIGERTVYTEVGTVIGTFEYMSPEQAELNNLDVDTRSDIYALGVILYELLTGTVPFTRKELQSSGFAEMLRIIKEQEPPKPSTRLSGSRELSSVAAVRHTEPAKLSRLIRGDLDWITMKALEKDRSRRYETANGLAMDIQRYLDDEPVLAGPPSAGYRLRKAVRRHKGPVLAAAMAVTALVVGLIGASWGMIRAERARYEAERARVAEAVERRRAEEAAAAEKRAKVTAQARDAESKSVLDFVIKRIISAARPAGQAGGLGHDVTLRQAIESARPFVHANFARQPRVEAALRMTLGTSFFYLGDAKTAAEEEEEARALFARHLGPDNRNTLWCMHNLASSYGALGRQADALKLREETLVLRKAKLGPDDPDTLASMSALATSYALVGRNDEALKLREETLALEKAKLGPDHPETLGSMINLANSYNEAGRKAEALKLREETLALQKDRLGPKHPDTLMSMNNLANSYRDAGRKADGLRLLEEVLALEKATLGPDHPHTLSSMVGLAYSYADVGRQADALRFREASLAIRQAKYGSDHPETLRSMNDLAGSYGAVGRLGDALKLYEEVLTGRLDLANPGDHILLTATKGMAQCQQALGRRKEAAAYWAKAQSLEPTDTFLLQAASAAILDAGDTETYTALCRKALKQFGGTNDPVAAERVAKTCLLVPPSAEDLPRITALAETAVTRGKDQGAYNWFLLVRGMAAYRVGDWEATLDWCGRSRKLRPGNQYAVPLNLLLEAMAHQKLGHTEPAREALAKAARLIGNHKAELPGGGKIVEHDWLNSEIIRKEAETLLKN
jgi:tetratricopeptide (TPR) repeat protein